METWALVLMVVAGVIGLVFINRLLGKDNMESPLEWNPPKPRDEWEEYKNL